LALHAPHFFAAQAPHFFAAQAPHFLVLQAPHFLPLHAPAATLQRARQPEAAQPDSAAAVTTAAARLRDSWEASVFIVDSWFRGWGVFGAMHRCTGARRGPHGTLTDSSAIARHGWRRSFDRSVSFA
jgi:hypothetical protein